MLVIPTDNSQSLAQMPKCYVQEPQEQAHESMDKSRKCLKDREERRDRKRGS